MEFRVWFRSVWNWLRDNWAPLTSLAALATLVGLLFGLPWPFGVDVIIRTERDEFAFPPEFTDRVVKLDSIAQQLDSRIQMPSLDVNGLSNATQRIAQLTNTLMDSISSLELLDTTVTDKLLEEIDALRSIATDLQETAPDSILDEWNIRDHIEVQKLTQGLIEILLDPIHAKLATYRNQDIGKTTITVLNNTDSLVSGIRLRLSDVADRLWDVNVDGTFITKDQESTIRTELMNGVQGYTLIFPEIVDLPPDSSLKFEIYSIGSVEFSELGVAAPGYSYSFEEIVEVENTWLVKLTHDPMWKTVFWLVLICIAVLVIGQIIDRRAKLRKIQPKS